jgi:hypothetical protein
VARGEGPIHVAAFLVRVTPRRFAVLWGIDGLPNCVTAWDGWPATLDEEQVVLLGF